MQQSNFDMLVIAMMMAISDFILRGIAKSDNNGG
jgi:hypothetical protein